MAGPNETGLDKGYKADSAIPQFYAVHATAEQSCTLADGTVFVLGICQEEISANDAILGRIAAIRLEGISRAVSGGAIALNAPVAVVADGRVVTHTGAVGQSDIIGRCSTPATAAGQHIDLWLVRA